MGWTGSETMKEAGQLNNIFKKTRRIRDYWIPSILSKTPRLGKLNQGSAAHPPLTKNNFLEYSYSRRSHFYQLEIPDFHQNEFIDYCDLKIYQDTLIYNFIVNNFPPGARLLEIGGGNSRIIQFLKSRYECWNLDKLEGQGFGPRSIQNPEGYFLVRNFIGEFSPLLSDNYFDCVFSISVLEHIPVYDDNFERVVRDINRVLKPGGFSIHCIDIILNEKQFLTNPILDYLYDHLRIINPLIPLSQIKSDPDLWVLPRYSYYTRWVSHTRQLYWQFGRPFSYNVLWQEIDF
jgi:SAM-dependent methyltransferase